MAAPGWLTKYGGLIRAASGSDLPLAMMLGHVQLESGGRPNDRTNLDERGLMQIHPATSKEMGFDHNRMFDPAYSVEKGAEMFRRMATRTQHDYPSLFPARNDFFWRMVRFEFSIGSGATRQVLRAMLAAGVRPVTWSQFTDYLERHRAELLKLVKHDPVKWSNFVDRVFSIGEKLAGVAAVSTISVVVGVALGAAVFALLLVPKQKARAA
jgi:hypothetical protein